MIRLTKIKTVKRCLLALCALLTVVIGACNQHGQNTAVKQRPKSKINNIPPPVAAATKQAAADTDTLECPRGAALPVIKKTVFPDARFALQADRTTGIETLTLASGDKVSVKQSGCEYYVLGVRFETSHFAADTTNLAYWGHASLELMHSLSKGLDCPLEISNALKKLSKKLDSGSTGQSGLQLGDEIDFGGPDPRQYLTLDRITQIDSQHYAIELSFSYGPI